MAAERKRRQYGTGSVHRRASDGRWIGTIEAGWTRTGGRRRITVSAKTEAECRQRLRDRQRDIAKDGMPTEGAGARTTVKAWSVTWLAELEHHARPRYYATEASVVRRWLIPTIGHKELARLTPADVRAVTTAIRKAGKSSTTAAYAQGTLTRMLRAAIVEGHQVPERLLHVQAPGKAASDRDAIPLDQAVALLAAAANEPDGSRWVAAILQGMRQGECLGLTWECVDLDAGTLDVSWQAQPLPYRIPYDRTSGFRIPDGYEARHLTGAWHLTRPKTSAGKRIIPLVTWMSAALATWREVAPASPYGLVWPDANGLPRRDVDDRAAWYALQEKVGAAHPSGRPWLLHEARHATATLLLESDVSERTVIEIMGHSRIATTRGYQHVSPTMRRRALDRIAERLQLGAAKGEKDRATTP
ncbi:site-specific integrase [Actinotalea sp. M2MS4P-6]|uniref:tyrosine-type recombinase/integrase n=1 Tax=Actinotalea sp. M2MS4P-6 TaxID=2983762 RepID=UPI0021E4748F|nr:site-specific integrase [Actinotalea sp. M2MS4P-6]MCV2395900.1 site-specific integrase [Actinotalea sp. M2MS4P-6]